MVVVGELVPLCAYSAEQRVNNHHQSKMMSSVQDDVSQMSLMEGSWAVVMCWAVFTTRWRAFWSDTEQLLGHTEMYFVSMLSMVQG